VGVRGVDPFDTGHVVRVPVDESLRQGRIAVDRRLRQQDSLVVLVDRAVPAVRRRAVDDVDAGG